MQFSKMTILRLLTVATLATLLLLTLISTAESAGKDIYDCFTPKGVYGKCIDIKDCESLASILKQPKINRVSIGYLQNSTCGFADDKSAKVCCPNSEKVETNIDTPTTQHDSPLITTEKPPEHPSGEDNQSESSSKSPQEEPEKIISHENLLPNASHCGTSTFEDKIVGGKDAGLGKFPWVVLLGYQDANGNTQWACGGSLISSRYVLTAAHCVTELPSFIHLATVKVGEYNQSTDPDFFDNGRCAPKVQIIKIEEVIAHEHYDEKKRKENDIALLRLQNEAVLGDFVRPVCLPRGEKVKKTTKDFVVAGFGRLSYDSPEGSNVLQFVKVPILSTQKCNNFYADKEQVGAIDNSRFCAGGEDGKDSCKGDSGGPLMTALIMENSNSQTFFQYGIVSLGPSRCGVAGQPALYTRVTHFKQWILDHIRP